MKTLTCEFNQKIKTLKEKLVFEIDTIFGSDHEMIIEILEPTCNMNFVNTIIGITTEGKIITQQYDYDNDSVMTNNFKDIISVDDKRKVINLLTKL